jgi:hypothetical protein
MPAFMYVLNPAQDSLALINLRLIAHQILLRCELTMKRLRALF